MTFKKKKPKSLKMRIRNSGGGRAGYAKAISNFAIDIQASGLFQRVAMKVEMQPRANDPGPVAFDHNTGERLPVLVLELTPLQNGPAHLCDATADGLHVEKIRLSGVFNIHSGSRRSTARALELDVHSFTLKGYLPDTAQGARRHIDTGVKWRHGRPHARGYDILLPKDQRRASIEIPASGTVRFFNDNAASFVIGLMMKHGFMANTNHNQPQLPPERSLPDPAQRRINARQGMRRNVVRERHARPRVSA